MSTTLIPPSYYVVKPRGQTARVFPAIAQAATTLVMLGGTPATVSAITGSRTRSLTETELRELRQRVRAQRLHARAAQADKRAPATPPADTAGGDPRGSARLRTRRAGRGKASAAVESLPRAGLR